MTTSINEVSALGGYWTELLSFPGMFVSPEGQVASVRSGRVRILKGTRSGKYLALSVAGPGRPYLHRVICETFHGPAASSDLEVRHLDGDRDNNAARNLAWGTRKQNAADKVRHGTTTCGERNPRARLTAVRVAEMRAYHGAVKASYRAIGELFGVSTMTAYRAIRGESWK